MTELKQENKDALVLEEKQSDVLEEKVGRLRDFGLTSSKHRFVTQVKP